MAIRILLPVIALIAMGCGQKFEPEIKGWRAYALPGRPLVHLEIDGKETMIALPGNQTIGYRFVQWTKSRDEMLLAQITRTEECFDFRIVAIDTTGSIIDTVYTAPPNTALNFKLAPNDSVLLLKTYDDDCVSSDHYKYTFYNRYLKKALPDTIPVDNARGLLLPETVWSPDSRKVILAEWSGRFVKAFVYDLITKDTTYIDKGSKFVWSPSDNDLIAYIKDYSIYTRNITTGATEILFQGKKKKSATDFRWNPNGDFLMIHIRGYLLNVEANPLQTNNIIYYSVKDKTESRVYYDGQRIDTWK